MTSKQRWVHVKKLRSTLRAARKEHQMREVEAITTPTAVFKLMHSAKRAVILRDALLARHQATDDLPPFDAPSTNQIPWNDHVSDEEIRRAL